MPVDPTLPTPGTDDVWGATLNAALTAVADHSNAQETAVAARALASDVTSSLAAKADLVGGKVPATQLTITGVLHGSDAATARPVGVPLVIWVGTVEPSNAAANDLVFLNDGAAADTTAPTTPTDLTATPSSGQVALSWTASTDAVGVTGYRVYRDAVLVGSPTTTSYTDTGLTNGTAYSYTVSAVDAAGNESAQTAAVSATPAAAATVPGQVTGLTGTAGETSMALTWTAPSNGGSAITDYVVQYAAAGSGSWATFADGTSTTTSATVTGLTAGTSYDFRVAAVNSVGTGAYSTTYTASTTAAATAPGAPTIGTATAGDTTASVAFTAPASDGGSPITGYTATSSPGGLTGTGTSSPITVSGLTNGTAYTFTVTATNAVGTGPASAASNSVTPASAGPALPALATFTKADGAGLPNTETGNFPWTLTSVGGTGTATYGVKGNAAAIWGTGTGGTVSATIQTNAADVTIRTKVAAFPGSGAVHIVFRLADQDNYWMIVVNATSIALAKRIAGTYTLVTNVTGQTFVAGDVFEVVLSGTSIIARKQAGADLISSTQSELQTATRHGFTLPNGDTTARLDDFEVTA